MAAFAVLLALVEITVRVSDHYSDAKDTATVLGIVIPALATIGAAVFGVSVAYSVGSKSGEAKGATGKVTAVAAARTALASGIAEHLAPADKAVAQITRQIEATMPSPAGHPRFETVANGQGSLGLGPARHGADRLIRVRPD